MKRSSKEVDADFCLSWSCFLPSGFLDYCFAAVHPAAAAAAGPLSAGEPLGQMNRERI